MASFIHFSLSFFFFFGSVSFIHFGSVIYQQPSSPNHGFCMYWTVRSCKCVHPSVGRSQNSSLLVYSYEFVLQIPQSNNLSFLIFCPFRLNDVRINDCQWSAQLLPKNTTNSVISSSDARQGVGSQISNLMTDLKRQLQMKRVHLEDLENLHHAIFHLKECSSASHNRAQELLWKSTRGSVRYWGVEVFATLHTL